MPDGTIDWAFIPPRPAIPERERSPFRIMTARNVLAAIPRRAYEEALVATRFRGRTVIVLNEPGEIRQVTSNLDGYTKPMPGMRATRPILGSGLVLAEGGEWRRQRREAAPHFAPRGIGRITSAV